MLETIKEIFLSPAGSLGSVLSLFIAIFFVVYKAGKIVEKFGLVQKIENSIDRIKEDIAEIKVFIRIFRQENNPLAQTNSPITLSPKGKEVANELQVKQIIDSKWDILYKKIKNQLKDEDNPYNIQEICFKLGETYSKIVTEEEFDIIKTFAYKQGLSLQNLDIVFGIVIRDKFFEAENINIADVDKHTPEKLNP